jgi:acetyl esterase
MDGMYPRLTDGEVTIAEARAQIAALSAAGEKEEVASVQDRAVPGPDGNEIPVRIYHPSSPPAVVDGAGLPGVVYFHGGGFVNCGIETHDAICRQLTNAVGTVTVSVDYRLAPDHAYPAAADDSYAAATWVGEHAAELGIAVAGDSAGGNLAAVVALMARDRGGPTISFQLLVYPVIDMLSDYPSATENATGYFLERRDMDWYRAQYLPDISRGAEPYVAPIKAKSLAGLPPAYILTAEHDPLRDEGEAYGEALQAAGVPTTVRRAQGLFHSFFNLGAYLPQAKLEVDAAFTALREALTA